MIMKAMKKEDSSCKKNLKLLWWMRSIAITGQAVAVFVVDTYMAIPLPVHALWAIIFALCLVNCLTFLVIKSGRRVGEREFFFQLLTDMLALFGLLYYTGGASNPFTSLFILQVVIAAIILPAIYTWMIAAGAVGLYTLLMFWNVEMPYLHHHLGEFFNLHVQGMWLSFVLLSLIISGFAVKMSMTIRRQDALLAEAEKIAAVGALAANAAHELGTPLATLSLLAEDLDKNKADPFFYQLTRCKEIISRITTAGGLARAESGTSMPWEKFLHNLIERWKQSYPTLPVTITIQPGTSPRILADQGLVQAIVNILNNAAEASPEGIQLDARWNAQYLTVMIQDKGKGFPEEMLSHLGEIGLTTKPKGMGMGLFLAKNMIHRYQGTLTFKNIQEGAVVTIHLPLKAIML